MNTTTLRQIIKEAITDRLKMIDEAGDKAAINAKIAKIEEDIQEAQQIMSAIPENISHYAAPEIVSDLKEDLQNSIDELEAKKQELQDSLTSMDKPVKAEKPAKAKAKTEEKPAKKKAKELSEAGNSNKIEWISSDFSPIEGIKIKKGDKGEIVKQDTGNQYLVKFNNHRFYAQKAKNFKELNEAVFSSTDVNAILKAAKAALESGKTVTVDGRAISKVVPAAGAFFPADGSPSLRIKNYLGNMSAIEIDGKPAELKPYEPKKDAPSTHIPTDAEKAAYNDRFGPNGGVQTAFGKYTGD